jgi:CHAT domain-containing protein/Tfp pilus assembly protein PilF
LALLALSHTTHYALPMQDRTAAAEQLVREAEVMRAKGTKESLGKAIEKYKESLPLWRTAGDSHKEGNVLYQLGFIHSALNEWAVARRYYDQSLSLARAHGYRREEAVVLRRIAGIESALGTIDNALALFAEALEVCQADRNKRGEAETLNDTGAVLFASGEIRKAVAFYRRAFEVYHTIKDAPGQATTLNNLAISFTRLGEYQMALDHYAQALAIKRQIGDLRGEAVILNNSGRVYLDLGEHRKAAEFCSQALSAIRRVGDKRVEAAALTNMGLAYSGLQEHPQAFECYERALKLYQEVSDWEGEASALNMMAETHVALGEYANAISRCNQALQTIRTPGRALEAAVLANLGWAHSRVGERAKGLEILERALSLGRATLYARVEATVLYRMARIEEERANLKTAVAHVESALAAFESIRYKIAARSLRTTYFASAGQCYGLYVNLLMRLDQLHPGRGYAERAFEANERARARTLLESLGIARGEIKSGVDPALLEEQRHLKEKLDARSEKQVEILNRKHTQQEIAAIAQDVERLAALLYEVESQIAAKNPRYSDFMQPRPLSLAEIQQKVLDQETLLLEYALGESESYLWVVSRTSLATYRLPGRAQIETAARRMSNLAATRSQSRLARIRTADVELDRASRVLGYMLLGPARDHLGSKRLLIVADGPLSYVPFAALYKPLSSSARAASERGRRGPGLLIDEHEIVGLPSASTLAILRREASKRDRAANAVLVFADPVFDKNDARIRNGAGQPAPAPVSAGPESDVPAAVRGMGFRRLLLTRQEAMDIASIAPKGEATIALDFDASRAAVTGADLSKYRTIHFATHGLLNNEHPESSGIVLSLFDEKGMPQNGFLRLFEIYNLDLAAELVVLSACQSGLGKDVRGEGIIGLTRGFMHAGAERVVASTWKVDDQATAELMKSFYQGMLKHGQSPAAALRAAQISMRKRSYWRSPFYWASFTLHGEYR